MTHFSIHFRLSTQLQQDAKKIKQANTQKAKHAQFLQQKSKQYEKLIASLQVNILAY